MDVRDERTVPTCNKQTKARKREIVGRERAKNSKKEIIFFIRNAHAMSA